MPVMVEPVTLTGQHVSLVPLALEHASDLLTAGQHADIWRYLPRPGFTAIAEVEAWIAEAHAMMQQGGEMPFAIIEQASGRAVGSTRYLDIRPADHGLEIGWTWITPRVQRSAVNTECKYLLLAHAFDTLGAVRVQLKTDGCNLRSQQAITRIGAQREGVLRKHRRMWDGYIRDSVYYSILDHEWPTVRQRLETFLQHHDSPAERS